MATLADVLRQTGYAQDGTLATPTPVESPMTKVLSEHIKSLPQKFEQNQAEQMALLAKAYPGNTYESMMTQGDPKALAELGMQTPFNAMIAYHGTPHNILGKFDISKVGTGEGAQAYGHGMYFAEAPAVADQYRKDLSAIVNYDLNTKKYQVLDKQRKLLGEYDDMAKAGQEAEKAGNLYKVDIPDEYIPNMLDWDKPFKDQTPSVQSAIKQLESKIRQINPDFKVENAKGEGIYRAYQQYRGNNPDFASEGMNELGIKGIRYLDQGSRPTSGGELIDVFKTPEGWKSKIRVTNRTGTDFLSPTDMFTTSMPFKTEAEAKAWANEKINSGTSNFVVFDPSEVKILEKNNQPVSRKELIEKQIKALKDTGE